MKNEAQGIMKNQHGFCTQCSNSQFTGPEENWEEWGNGEAKGAVKVKRLKG